MIRHPDASIIVCTRNRSADLGRLFKSLRSLHIPINTILEIVVVDNGSTDDTKSVVHAVSQSLPIICVHESRPGLGHARNVGIAASSGQVVLMTDDDCIVTPDWLEVAVQLLADNPRQLIGGRVDLFDPHDLPVTIKTDPEPGDLASCNDLLGFVHGANLAFGRCVIDELGGFDDALGAGTPCKAGEDADFVYRALQSGIPVRYRPELRIAHNHGRKHPSEQQRLEQGYAISIGALAIKHALKGKVDILKLVYWDVMKDMRRTHHSKASDYLSGGITYLRSTLIARPGKP